MNNPFKSHDEEEIEAVEHEGDFDVFNPRSLRRASPTDLHDKNKDFDVFDANNLVDKQPNNGINFNFEDSKVGNQIKEE